MTPHVCAGHNAAAIRFGNRQSQWPGLVLTCSKESIAFLLRNVENTIATYMAGAGTAFERGTSTTRQS